MGLIDRFRRGSSGRTSKPARDGARTGSTRVRAADRVDEQHLHAWVTARRGVEGFVEPRTAVSDVTLLLVAHDGEWTRRRVPSVEWAHQFCNNYQVPSYDAAVVGIPQRMRDWNRRHKEQERRQDG
ncbi:hypothetical protein [Nocardioides pantholopis]|uniref:hypothetical protein n=1 Tax=Nocardioides pantholopis TaxID=2483798 RepID=UPI0013E380E6|nr:hypothetical protein [Nocardioides pantholopis]